MTVATQIGIRNHICFNGTIFERDKGNKSLLSNRLYKKVPMEGTLLNGYDKIKTYNDHPDVKTSSSLDIYHQKTF